MSVPDGSWMMTSVWPVHVLFVTVKAMEMSNVVPCLPDVGEMVTESTVAAPMHLGHVLSSSQM